MICRAVLAVASPKARFFAERYASAPSTITGPAIKPSFDGLKGLKLPAKYTRPNTIAIVEPKCLYQGRFADGLPSDWLLFANRGTCLAFGLHFRPPLQACFDQQPNGF